MKPILTYTLVLLLTSCISTQVRIPNEYTVMEIISQSEKRSVVRLENSNGSQLKGRYIFPTDTLKRGQKVNIYWVVKL